MGPVVYEEAVGELAGEFLSEYETIQMSVELTADERAEYDEEYQIYRDYVDSHDFDLWKANGYQEFLKRTSYDPQGRRALIAKQRAETIARTANKSSIRWITCSNATTATVLSSSPRIMTSPTTSPKSSSFRVSPTRQTQTNAPRFSTDSAAVNTRCW